MACELISEGILEFDAVFSPDSWYSDEDIYLAYQIYNMREIRKIISLPDN